MKWIQVSNMVKAASKVYKSNYISRSVVEKSVSSSSSKPKYNISEVRRYFATEDAKASKSTQPNDLFENPIKGYTDEQLVAKLLEQSQGEYDYEDENAPVKFTKLDIARFLRKSGLAGKKYSEDKTPEELKVTEPLMDTKIDSFIEGYIKKIGYFSKISEAVDFTLPKQENYAKVEKEIQALQATAEEKQELSQSIKSNLDQYYAEVSAAQSTFNNQINAIKENGLLHGVNTTEF